MKTDEHSTSAGAFRHDGWHLCAGRVREHCRLRPGCVPPQNAVLTNTGNEAVKIVGYEGLSPDFALPPGSSSR
jgi:hypothetical protein